jgi:hypothetical protein
MKVLEKLSIDERDELLFAMETSWEGEEAERILRSSEAELKETEIKLVLKFGERKDDGETGFLEEPLAVVAVNMAGARIDMAIRVVAAFDGKNCDLSWFDDVEYERRNLSRAKGIPTMGDLIQVIDELLNDSEICDLPVSDVDWIERFGVLDKKQEWEVVVSSEVFPELEAYYEQQWERNVLNEAK